MRHFFVEDHILLELKYYGSVKRSRLLDVYKTAEVHEAIWSLIEKGKVRWDSSDYETILPCNDYEPST